MITAGESASEGGASCDCGVGVFSGFLATIDASQRRPVRSSWMTDVNLDRTRAPQLATAVKLMVLLIAPATSEKGIVRLKLYAGVAP